MFDNIRQDLRHARLVNIAPDWWGQNLKILLQPATIAVLNYRLSRWTLSVQVPVLRQLLMVSASFIRTRWDRTFHVIR